GRQPAELDEVARSVGLEEVLGKPGNFVRYSAERVVPVPKRANFAPCLDQSRAQRSVGHVIEEIAWAKKAFPEVKEFFFDDDTLTDDLPRVEAIAKELSKLGVTWSCNAKPNVPRKTLEILRDNGLHLLLVGYESGNQKILHNIKKGI